MEKEKAKVLNTFYTNDRKAWRKWLSDNFQKETEVWFVFPMKNARENRLSYNDAVEKALCFGWIDSTIRNIDSLHRAQRFTPRKKGSTYSRPNIERLIWLESQDMIIPEIREDILAVINTPYHFPKDILDSIKKDKIAWNNYLNFPDSYKRIRVAYIDAARKRPLEFQKRLHNFINKSRDNKLIGYGGIDKYY